MKINFDLDINDWIAFQEYYKLKKAPVYRLLMPVLFVSAIMLVVLNVIYLSHHEASRFTAVSGGLLLLISCLFLLKGRSKNRLLKMALDMQAKHPDVFGRREMTFDEKGITIQTAKNSRILLWRDIDKQEENKDYNFIYTKNGMVYIVPKNKIDGDLSAFRTNTIK